MRILNWPLEQLLRTSEVGPLLETAVRSSGWDLESWSLDRVYSRPHGETSARFNATVSGTHITLVASTRTLSETDRQRLGAVRCEAGVGALFIWAHPSDPELPGLHVIETPTSLTDCLAAGLDEELTVTDVQMLVLRPLRRAVYRVAVVSDSGPRVLFLKVVRPSKAAELLARHRACTLTPPTTDLGGGILMMDQAPGVALTELLYQPSSPNPEVSITPDVIISALQAITPQALHLRARSPVIERFGSMIDALVIGGADRRRVDTLTSRIIRQARSATQSRTPTHGDFHPANLFLTEDAQWPSALIDADTVGPGNRADDLATMCAHLLALPSFDAAGYGGVPALVTEMWGATAGAYGEDLLARTAASLLSIAPGARSPQQLDYYISQAEHLLDTGHMSCIGHPVFDQK